MPTLIDEFVTKLSLDPSEFEEGERRLYDALRRLEATASRGGKQVLDATGTGVVSFFRTIEHPISSLRAHFERLTTYIDEPGQHLRRLGDTGRRTGEDVASGALAGARGLRVLGAVGLAVGTAGLTAFAAYEALSKAMGAAGGAAQKLFATGIGAQTAGIGVRGFSAISQAMFDIGNVPREQTQATLAQWHAWQDLAQTGGAAGDAARNALIGMGVALPSLTRLGVPAGALRGIDFWNADVERNFFQLSRAFAQVPERQFDPGAIASMLNLTPEQVYGMRKAGALPPAELQNYLRQEFARAPTDKQREVAERLIQAENNFSLALENFTRAFFLSGLANKLVDILNWIARGLSPGGGGGEGGPINPALATGARGIVAAAKGAGANESATAVMLSAASVEGGLGADAWKPNAQGSGARGRWQLLGDEKRRYLAEGNQPGDDAAQTRYVLKRLNEIWGQMFPNRTDTFSTSTDTAAQVQVITKFENSGQGTDYYARNLDAARRLIAQPPPLPQSAGSPPQGSIADDWSNYTKDMPHYQHGGFVPFDQVARLHGGEFVLPAARTPELDGIRRAMASAGSATRISHHVVNMHGDVIVNAPVREARTIASAVSDELRRVSLAASANTGLE